MANISDYFNDSASFLPTFDWDLFTWPCFYNPKSVYVKKNTDLDKPFDVEQFISKKQTKQ